MVLKQLEIQGFKSFPDRTRILIEPGITAVVGPNGSGKSNISDAIRWVLGETSSRQLRGSGKMEDVIFGGTQMRGAMGFASVALTVNNSDRRLDIDADEVVIGRKYYRSGESEYTLNGQAVRLKDIYELLLDTGVGRDGYSIIGQGRIAEIVGAKSAERREIFEEASGIAKYRYRKNEAEHRLASAEENLERLRDILGELEGRVGPLEKECAKANRFLELSARRKELEVTLWMDSMRRARDVVREEQRKYEAGQAEYDRLTEEISRIDEESGSLREDMQRIAIEIERCNADIRSITEEMSGADSQIAVLNNDIAHNHASMESLQKEKEQSAAGQEQIAQEIAENRSKIETARQKIEGLETAIRDLQNQLETIQTDNLRSGERRGAVTAAMAQLTERQTEARVTAAAKKSAVEAATARLQAASHEQQEAAENLKKQQEEQKENTEYLKKLEETLARLENIKNGLSMKLQKRRQHLKQADDAEQTVTREIEHDENRLQILRDLEKNMEGYPHSVKSVMKAANDRRLPGILGTVSNLLTVQRGYETAIETALGASMQNIVVAGEASAKQAIAYLKDTRSGRATFLPLDTVRGQTFHGSLSGSAVVASSLVRCDEKYEGIVAFLLGRIIVVDDLNEASKVARELGYRNRVVTVDGQVINAGGSFTGGSTAKSAGIFSRRQEIEELRQNIEKLKKQQQTAQDETDRCKAEVDALTAELTAAESEALTAGGDKIRAEMEQNRLNGAVSQLCAAQQLLAGETDSLQQQIDSDRAEAEKMQAEDERIAAQLEAYADELSRITAGDDSFLQTRTRLSDELGAARMEHLAEENNIALAQAAIDTLESRTGETSQRAQEIQQSLQALQQLNEQNLSKIEQIQKDKQTCQSRIAEKEQAIREAAKRRLEREQASAEQNRRVRTISDQREKLSQEMARLIERKANAETEYDQASAKLWEEYELTQTQAQELCIPFENSGELRRLVTEVRGKIRELGNVNVGAIEEYREVKERYDFLHAQVSDVEKSRGELLRMISELSGEMREIFTASFKTINENFGRIFREMFGGGDAHLELSDPDNVLESGIDITVAPPGKVIKNLSALSGGEQALVAISIYFAILAVNPAPFCILDEIEAALDDVNVVRYAQYLRRICDKTQFIVITHRRGTMEAADILYGVTMQEDGVSKLLRLDLEHVDASLVS